MQCLYNVVLVSAVCLFIVLITPGKCDASISGGGESNAVVGRPSRPQSFASPEELRTYLDQLSNYLAIASRPRFGKRFAPAEQHRPTLKKMFADHVISRNHNKVNNNNNKNNEVEVVDVDDVDDEVSPSSTLRYNRYPTNSDLYQLLYQYDE